MPKCKMSNCREEAVPYGKRYCPHHMQQYKRKQAEYAAISATLRQCACCGEKLTKTSHDRGDLMCRSCEERVTEEKLQNAYAEKRLARKREKDEAFERANSVDELKDWIKRYAYGE